MFDLFVELEPQTGHQVAEALINELNTPSTIINYYAATL